MNILKLVIRYLLKAFGIALTGSETKQPSNQFGIKLALTAPQLLQMKFSKALLLASATIIALIGTFFLTA